MAVKKKQGAGWNFFLIVMIIAIFAVALYMLYADRSTPKDSQIVLFGKSDQEKKVIIMSELTTKYESKTLQYIDREFGYKIRFPIGYGATINPFPDIHQRIAAFYPPFGMELMDIRILRPAELSEADIQGLAVEAKSKLTTETINGNKVFLMYVTEPSAINENSTVYMRQAFFQCTDPKSASYWLSFTGGVTEELTPDLELIEYMLRTIEC